MIAPLRPGVTLVQAPVIETTHLRLRQWQHSDMAPYTKMLSDPPTAAPGADFALRPRVHRRSTSPKPRRLKPRLQRHEVPTRCAGTRRRLAARDGGNNPRGLCHARGADLV